MQGFAVSPGQMQLPNERSLPLTKRADGRTLVFADDEIALPVSRLRAVFRGEGTLVDYKHRLLEPRPALLSARMSTPVIPSRAQR